MIKLLPITALNYDLPTDPNELDVYINIDDKTAKKLASPGCDGLTFDDMTGLSSRVLHQLVRNHFRDTKQEAEYQWFVTDQTFHKQFTHFMDTLVPEKSFIDLQHHDWHQAYTYQGQKNGQLTFRQYYYAVENSPIKTLNISI